jgi:PAS domain S-box-containing protein
MTSHKNSLLIDRDGTVRFASCFFCDLVHIDFKTVGGKSFFDFVFPEDAEVVKAQLEGTKRSHASPFVLKLKRSDGSPVWTEFRRLPVESTSSEVYAMTITLASDPVQDELKSHSS